MSVECNLIISLLKLTKNGAVLTEVVNKEARMPSATTIKLLEKMQNEDLVYLEQGFVEITSGSRLKLAIQAIALGADIEHVSNLLCWQEFEEITALALKDNGYAVANNVRFRQARRKWEIDVVGCKKPFVICIDCKHWQHAIAPSALKRIVESQIERTCALADSLPNPYLRFECTQWSDAKFMPVILSLVPSAFKFQARVPVVPILQLQDFLNQLAACTETLRIVNKTFRKL